MLFVSRKQHSQAFFTCSGLEGSEQGVERAVSLRGRGAERENDDDRATDNATDDDQGNAEESTHE